MTRRWIARPITPTPGTTETWWHVSWSNCDNSHDPRRANPAVRARAAAISRKTAHRRSAIPVMPWTRGESRAGDRDDGERDESEQETTGEVDAASAQPPLSAEEQQAMAQWLRRVPDDPGGLLRRKFQLEYSRRRKERPEGTDAW